MKLSDDNVPSTPVTARYMRSNSTSDIWLTKRSTLLWQYRSPPELTFVSQPEGIELSQLHDYVFNETGGRNVSVYVFDSGANIANPDFLSMPGGIKRGSITWLWPKDAGPLSKTDEDGHGTCVASKAVGNYFGVAKSADLVLVKPRYKDTWNTVKASDFFKWFALIYEDVKEQKMQGKAVLNISIGGFRLDLALDFINTWQKMIKNLLKNDVVVVVASGNYGVSHYTTLCCHTRSH